MADSDDDFDEAWNNDEVETAPDPLKYIAKRISDIEALAIERLAAENITPADLQAINYQAVVGATVICKQDVFTKKLPSDAELPAMIWAACQEIRSERLSTNQKSLMARFITQMERELRLKDYQPYVQRGQKSEAGLKASNIDRYGTTEEKERRYSEYQEAVDRYHKQHPDWGYEALKSQVAEDFGCCTKTIQRHTKNPCEKS